jgi:hypothetical protein
MASQKTTMTKICLWLLVFVTSIAGINFAHSGDRDCPPSVASSKRVCPPHGPAISISPPTPEHRAKAERNMREAEAHYLSQPQPAPQTGIFPGEEVREQLGAGSSYYLIENAWYGIVGGVEVAVYAGSMRSDPADESVRYDPSTIHGFVIIRNGPLGDPNATTKQIFTPKPVGSLRIISAKATVLALRARQGIEFSLDIKTGKLLPLGASKK